MPPTNSRKRPAPGTSPINQQQVQLPMNYSASPQMQNDQFLNWAQDGSNSRLPGYPEPPMNFNSNIYNTLGSQTVTPEASNQLTRRPVSQHVAMRGQYNGGGNEVWTVDDTPQQTSEESWNNDDAHLTQKAMIAKREALAKRKSIPPFVQKLSSFLDESRNTDLIRWSSRGDSFVVLDEDEFAKTLIPELFKHNNYASFVRQLNMYGFHKKVGLSDNSMRASERKNKSPSEYYNPYFRQGKPNLLWLIQKPKPTPGKGKAGSRVKQEDENNDEDGEDNYEVESAAPIQQGVDDSTAGLRSNRQPLMIDQGGNSLPQAELAALRREVHAVQEQQRIISNVMQKLKREHDAQAAAFHELHARHENSINAILTFLATVYNRSLEGRGVQELQSLFAGAIPTDNQRQGSVVDVGEYNRGDDSIPDPRIRRPIRRQPLLIGAPPLPTPVDELDMSTTTSPAASGMSTLQQPQPQSSAGHTPRNVYSPADPTSPMPSAIHEIFNQNTPDRSSESPRFPAVNSTGGGLPERDIMSFINSTNTSDTNFLGNNRMDFPQALSHLQTADGKSPLTPNQRNNVLQLIANGSANANAANNNLSNNNNALTSPNPPEISLPSTPHWNTSKDELEFLERTLKEQDSKVAILSSMLQPLSPSGKIPGLNDPQGYSGLGSIPSDDLVFEQMFNGDYFDDSGTGAELDFAANPVDFDSGADFNFDNAGNNGASNGLGLDGSDDHHGERVFETLQSSEATSPANTVDESLGQDEGRSPRKRRRRK